MDVPTPHNAAKKNEIAKTVLLPGDPGRAEYIAKKYLSDWKQVTSIRGVLGFTGKYKDKLVTIMSSGMGGPSAGIYSFELFKYYDVEQIIRIGTAGGFKEYQKPGDLVFAMSASTDSNYAHQYDLKGTFCPSCNFNLLKKASEYAEANNIRYNAGAVFSSDLYSKYSALGEDSWKKWANMSCLAQDMETYSLYCNAAYLNKKALSILTVVINLIDRKCTDYSYESLSNMIETALSLI